MPADLWGSKLQATADLLCLSAVVFGLGVTLAHLAVHVRRSAGELLSRLRLMPWRKHETACSTVEWWCRRAEREGERAVYHLGHGYDELADVTSCQRSAILPHVEAALTGRERTVLDFGCGPGRFSSDLARITGGEVLAVDPVRRFIDMAPAAPGVRYSWIADGKVPMPDSSYDVVWVCLVLGGLAGGELVAACSEIRRVLRTHGLLVLVENTSHGAGSSHWHFRSVEFYCDLFPSVALTQVGDYVDLSEKISIMMGRSG